MTTTPTPLESHGSPCCAVCGRPLADEVTGALDRHSWEGEAAAALARAARERRPLALILADLDRFKSVNDTYGHPAGDAVLRAAATVMRRRAEAGLVGRYGGRTGDEFMVLLPDRGLEAAMACARRIRREVKSLSIQAQANRTTTVTITGQTVSLGVSAGVPSPAESLSDLLLESDAALRAAKRGGGDQIRAAR